MRFFIISELINSMNIYDNELLLKQLLSMTDDIIEMINTKYDKIQLINFVMSERYSSGVPQSKYSPSIFLYVRFKPLFTAFSKA